MNQTGAQQEWIKAGRFDDVDAQAAHLHGFGQQYQQLSRGKFQGEYRSFLFGDDLGIHLEMANRELAQSASIPGGRYAICVLDEGSVSCPLNAVEFSADHVALCPEYKMLEGKTAEGMNLCCLDIASDLLPEEGYPLRTARITHDPRRARKLRELIRSGVSGFTQLDSPSSFPAATREFKSLLGDLLWELSTGSRDVHGPAPVRRDAHSRALVVFRRAREYIHHHLADGIPIALLCKDLGISRRSLESVFGAVVGVGPGNYIRALQLNHIRRDLMTPAHADLSIGVIAAHWGVWHWSRLSHHYQLLFGELPSETRTRAICITR